MAILDVVRVAIFTLSQMLLEWCLMEQRTKSMGLNGKTLLLLDFNLGTDEAVLQQYPLQLLSGYSASETLEHLTH